MIYTGFTTAVLALTALTIGSSALLRMAVFAVIVVLFSLVSVLLALYSAKLEMTLSVKRLERETALSYRLFLKYISFPPVGGLTFVTDSGEAITFETLPFQTGTLDGSRTFAHRGRYYPGKGRLFAEDMFGLFIFSRQITATEESVLVLPKERKFALPEIKKGDIGPEVRKKFDEDASEPSGVRDWQDGDHLKRVHWKLTMKTYDPSLRNLRPMVRTYDEAARPDTIVLADLSYIDAVEEWAASARDAVSEAAYGAVSALLDSENSVRMILAGEKTKETIGESPLEKETFRTMLAEAEFDGRGLFEESIFEAARHPERTGAVIVIIARMNMRIADALIRVCRTAGVTVSCVWVTDQRRGDMQEVTNRLESAGVNTQSINPLKDRE